MGRYWIMGAIAAAGIVGVVLGVHDGSTKAQIAVAIAPWLLSFLGILFFASLFVTNHYCLTNDRALSLRFAAWGSKFSAVRLADAEAIVRHKMPLVFRDRRSGKDAVTMLLTVKQEAEVLALLKRDTR